MHPRPTLPGQLPALVGRRKELQQVLDLLKDPGTRLVTILGAGGMGKSRLAIETGDRLHNQFPDGVYFIALASASSVDDLLPALAGSLGVQLPPSGDLQQAVIQRLGSRKALLILDNFEHLVEEALLVHAILSACPQVSALVTSRQKLGLSAETLLRLEGLALAPEGSGGAETGDALRLFTQKARQARPGFEPGEANIEAVTQICRLVNGNPLGILLAAAWVEHFSPQEILAEIRGSLDFLAGGARDADPRHACMRAVFASSYRRLDERQQAVFRKLACFQGGFDLAAAHAIAQTDLKMLIALVERCLLNRNPDTGRYNLHELLRQYAADELAAAGERDEAIMAHARYYTAFVRERGPRLISREQTSALDDIQADFDNIRQSLAVTVDRGDHAAARAVIPVLYAFCDMRSKFYEGESLFRLASEALAAPGGAATDPAGESALALALLSWYDMRLYIERPEDLGEIEAQAQACLAQATRRDDRLGMAASCVLLGAAAEGRGDRAAAIELYQRGDRLDPGLDDAYWVNMRIGLAQLALGQLPQARQAFETSLKRGQDTGEKVKTGWSFLNIGLTLQAQGDPHTAAGYLRQARCQFEEVNTTMGLVWSNYSLGAALLELGERAEALRCAQTADGLARHMNATVWAGRTAELLRRIDPQVPPAEVDKKQGRNIEMEPLSPRELDVLALLKSDLTGPEMARRMVVSLNTIRYHTKNIYQKLGVSSRLEAIRKAKELGL